MLIYLASALSNRTLNAQLSDLITSMGYECFLPQRDAPQETVGAVTAKVNADAIKKSDVVLVVSQGLGIDTSWEAGYATALGKETILLCANSHSVEKHYMVFHSSSRIVQFSTRSDLRSKLSKALHSCAELL